jgi:hypothetical protein
MESTEEYFYEDLNGNECGPFSFRTISDLLAARRINGGTKVRKGSLRIWTHAADVPELQQFFFKTSKPGQKDDAITKPLAQLSADDLPKVVSHFFVRYLDWLFFLLVYIPMTLTLLWMIFGLMWFGYWMRQLPAWTPFDFTVPTLCYGAACVLPILVWRCYRKKTPDTVPVHPVGNRGLCGSSYRCQRLGCHRGKELDGRLRRVPAQAGIKLLKIRHSSTGEWEWRSATHGLPR